jgi:hypothetical protein
MQSGPGVIPTFLYYFTSTTLIVVFVISRGLDPTEQFAISNNPFPIGIVLGVVAGGLGAYFNRYESVEVPIKNRGADLKLLTETLATLGYTEAEKIDPVTVYERPFPRNIFAGKLLIRINENSVEVSGRANRIRAFRKMISS